MTTSIVVVVKKTIAIKMTVTTIAIKIELFMKKLPNLKIDKKLQSKQTIDNSNTKNGINIHTIKTQL